MTKNEPGLTNQELTRIRRAARTDGSDIKGILTGEASRSPKVSTEECALLRCMRGVAEPLEYIGAELGLSASTIRIHATGRCGHNARVPVPPTVHRGVSGGGMERDERETKKRRRLWRVEREINSEAGGGASDAGGGAER